MQKKLGLGKNSWGERALNVRLTYVVLPTYLYGVVPAIGYGMT